MHQANKCDYIQKETWSMVRRRHLVKKQKGKPKLERHKTRLFSQCWGCLKFSKNKPEKMYFYKPPKNNGCRFINELYLSQNKY
jgi:hypothetical protein